MKTKGLFKYLLCAIFLAALFIHCTLVPNTGPAPKDLKGQYRYYADSLLKRFPTYMLTLNLDTGFTFCEDNDNFMSDPGNLEDYTGKYTVHNDTLTCERTALCNSCSHPRFAIRLTDPERETLLFRIKGDTLISLHQPAIRLIKLPAKE